jgi:hypothetical protein
MSAVIEFPRRTTRMSVRDWLDPMLREWGAQRRRIISGKLVRKDGSIHYDGWPSDSVAAAAREGGITGGSGFVNQHFAEVYSGDALDIWRAYRAAPIEVREILHLHFVVQLEEAEESHASRKAKILGVSKASYFNQLETARYYLAGNLDRPPAAA